MLGLLTVIHPLVDACSYSVLLVGGASWERVIVYNLLAFALQFPLGVLLDVRERWLPAAFLCGTGLILLAAGATVAGLTGWFTLAAVCMGNALFHLSAGKHLLETQDGRSGPIGLFISTGALGLLAGKWGFMTHPIPYLALFASALAAMTVLAVWQRFSKGKCSSFFMIRSSFPAPLPRHSLSEGGLSSLPSPPSDPFPLADLLITVGLFILIAGRSWAGMTAGWLTASGGILLSLAGAAAIWAGKAAGGYLAERLGRWRVTAASVCGSLVLVTFCPPEQTAAWLVLLVVSQLATGPLLSLLYTRFRGEGGTAFGLNCLALFTGGLG